MTTLLVTECVRSGMVGALLVLWLLQRRQLRELREHVQRLEPRNTASLTLTVDIGNYTDVGGVRLAPPPRSSERPS